MKLRILRTVIKADMIRPASEGAAAIDLRACIPGPVTLRGGEQVAIQTGIAVDVGPGRVGLILPRSGQGKAGLVLANSTGVIDSDYRGELIIVALNRNPAGTALTIHPLDRIAQLVIVQINPPQFDIVAELGETERGDRGFGSTGVV